MGLARFDSLLTLPLSFNRKGKIMDDLKTQAEIEQVREGIIRSLAVDMQFIAFCDHDVLKITGPNVRKYIVDMYVNDIGFDSDQANELADHLECNDLAKQVLNFVLYTVSQKLSKDLGIPIELDADTLDNLR